ncbi:5-(carboxyamino)imidazole ribonucleotide synthase [Sphingorhabdus sp.]|uniref:5-(carboxyamino)imidazole ribonucleotide synthase n=1 Tax=Sphingorhabdus sp. TaxID=1902408 RepID=UPI003918F81B
MAALPPGSTIGILGGGQLGRMLAIAAAQLGYRCHIFAPPGDNVACDVAPGFTVAEYDDLAALEAFAQNCDVVTFEFENVPVAPLESITRLVPVYPPLEALEVAQDRAAEKQFVRALGGRTAEFAVAQDESDVPAAIAAVGIPCILKTIRMGYDGKGQARITAQSDIVGAWERTGAQALIAEAMVSFDAEFSVILVRSQDGEIRFWDSSRNLHIGGILATSTLPSGPLVESQQQAARDMASAVATALNYVGVFTAEFFASAQGPLFNEIAPRVHNSGHWTIEGAATSQFENHIRAICGLPLGSTATVADRVEMHNLIGDDGAQFEQILADPAAHLHLYGKAEARPGRKIGHVTRLYR